MEWRRDGGGISVDTLAVGDVRIQLPSAVELLGVHLESHLSVGKQLSFLRCQSLFAPEAEGGGGGVEEGGFDHCPLSAHTQSC